MRLSALVLVLLGLTPGGAAPPSRSSSALKLKTTSSSSSSLISDLRQSAKLESASLQLTSATLCLAGFVSAAVSLFTFNLLTESINSGALAAGYKGSFDDLLIFDLRNGYSQDSVIRTLQSWQHGGRLKYLLIEAIDVTFYHSGYRAAFLVMYNKMTSALGNTTTFKPYAANISKLAYFPIILALLDFLEDLFQVAMTLLYDFNSDVGSSALFQAVAFCASSMNQIKWGAVRVGAPVFALTALTLLVMKAAQAARSIVASKKVTKL